MRLVTKADDDSESITEERIEALNRDISDTIIFLIQKHKLSEAFSFTFLSHTSIEEDTCLFVRSNLGKEDMLLSLEHASESFKDIDEEDSEITHSIN